MGALIVAPERLRTLLPLLPTPEATLALASEELMERSNLFHLDFPVTGAGRSLSSFLELALRPRTRERSEVNIVEMDAVTLYVGVWC